jgi:hypothetical protein
MKPLKTFSSLASLWMVILLLGAALAGTGCATPVESGSVGQDETELSSSLVSTPDVTAEAPASPSGVDTAACPDDPGVPVPLGKEQAFISCVADCVGDGNPRPGCWTACCREFTGCPMCYQR